MAETITDGNEPELLQEDDPSTSKEEILTTDLTDRNANSDSLKVKRLHEASGEADKAEPAKKAKLSAQTTHPMSESDEPDIEGLLNENSTDNVSENEKADQSHDDLLDEIARSLDETERTDEPVSEKLANIANKRWFQKLSDEQLKEKLGKYHRPVNCDKIIVPKVNPEIWGKLSRAAKGQDIKFSHLQTNLAKVGHIVVKSTDLLLKAKAENSKSYTDDLVRMNTDVIALLGHLSFELSQRRRDNIRPNLNKDYASLCAPSVPVTKFLFGDELQTQLSHIRASNEIGNTTNQAAPGSKQPKPLMPLLGRAFQSQSRLNNAKKSFNTHTKRMGQP